MENAIVPLNIAALRVNKNDDTNLVSQFKGRTARFEQMPYDRSSKVASTGEAVVQPLESGASPANPLGTGIHLHWELPDYFRRGTQPAQGGKVVFPPAPNRWLVIRYLQVFDAHSGQYGAVPPKCWIVESDYLATDLSADADGVVRPAVSVPLPTQPAPGTQPFMYMGRVVEYETWTGSESTDHYLPQYNGSDGEPLYLTSVGFVGPAFASFYPECCSVFGFWDHFKDKPDIYHAINPDIYHATNNDLPLRFKVSYQVFGWNHEASDDPLVGIDDKVKKRYAQYVSDCQSENVPVVTTPVDEFDAIAQHDFRWTFNNQDIAYTLNGDKTLKALTVPERTLCAGLMQEIVWNMTPEASKIAFLNNPPDGTEYNPLWSDTIKVAVGNTTVEGLSALIKTDMAGSTDDSDLLTNYEYLLDALQLGLLYNLEQHGNTLIELEESCHSKGFTRLFGGYLWIVDQKPKEQDPGAPVDPNQEVTLPLEIAEHLNLLNQAQKNYDQGRAALDVMRKQLFMDWFRYVKIYVSGVSDPYVDLNALTNFIKFGSGQCELDAVVDYGNEVGILQYQQDQVTAQITGIKQPDETRSLAAIVWTQFQAMTMALEPHPEWEIRAAPGSSFWMPTDPVLVMEGDRLEAVRRNGAGPNTPVRLSSELLSSLTLEYSGSSFTVNADQIAGKPTITSATPMQQDVATLVGEASLLTPMLANGAADALKAQTGTNNPAVANYGDFVTSLQTAQGGPSPFDRGDPTLGLYATVHTASDSATNNPVVKVTAPQAIDVTFTNAASNGWAPSAIAWNTQTALREFGDGRVDPFLPVFLIWTVQLDPLKRDKSLNYGAQNLTNYFSLDQDAVDYQYKMSNGKAVDFTTAKPISYEGSVVLSRKPITSLTAQIDTYERTFSTDPADATLTKAKEAYGSRKIVSQGLSGFNIEQTLRTYIAQIPVENLVQGGRDTITRDVNSAAIATTDDDWYDFAFNSQQPIATGLPAQFNFGPLRSGFAEIMTLEIVDVFGQRMKLSTNDPQSDGSQEVIAAHALQPAAGDTANENKIFLPPRVLAPTRLCFNWLSATHDAKVDGVSADFVEMNSHPATSPVCGWVLPNHLDGSLFFYDANGAAIGSFGVEQGDLKYRTRAGNLNNSGGDLELETDIGPKIGPPKVNAHLFNFMWFIDDKNAAFLTDLMTTIENSDKFINPANFAQDVSLAVLIGRPLALTRAVLGLETSGKLLPLSQADTTPDDAFPQDVKNNRYKYADRQAASSAALGDVRFPVRLGNLANIDDGLVGYLIEGAGGDPYSTFYSAAAPAAGASGVAQPSSDTIELTLNATPQIVTMLVDPRAPIHATTGILPVVASQIPPDQYARAMTSLAMTFFTHPILKGNQRLTVPLPQELGYQWSWVTPGSPDQPNLKAKAANEFAVFDYTPQTVLEGWLRLSPDASS